MWAWLQRQKWVIAVMLALAAVAEWFRRSAQRERARADRERLSRVAAEAQAKAAAASAARGEQLARVNAQLDLEAAEASEGIDKEVDAKVEEIRATTPNPSNAADVLDYLNRKD